MTPLINRKNKGAYQPNIDIIFLAEFLMLLIRNQKDKYTSTIKVIIGSMETQQ